MFYVNMLLLAFIVAFVVDYSGAVYAFREWFNRITGRPEGSSIKPFDCSLCLTFWTGIVYVLISGVSVPRLAFVCFCAFLGRFVGEWIFLLREAIMAAHHRLNDKIDEYETSENEKTGTRRVDKSPATGASAPQGMGRQSRLSGTRKKVR